MKNELLRNRKSNIPIGLHDSRIINIVCQESILTLKLDKMFRYTEKDEIIYTGEIYFTKVDVDDCSILIFDRIVYEGDFSGNAVSLTEYIEKYSNAEFEILTEVYNEYNTIFSGWVWEKDKEPVSGIINIYNTGEIIYKID